VPEAEAMTEEELYLQLADLVAEMPDLANGPITPEINKWLGRASVLVEQVGDYGQDTTIKVASQSLSGVHTRTHNAQTIASVVYRALARAELNAPARVQGTFIAAGDQVGAYAAVGKVLRTAKTDVLIIDAFADERLVSEYALLAPDNVTVRILSDAADHKKTLKPAADRWIKQFGQARPLAVRLAPDKTLHDRLIVIDGVVVWSLGQSFNRLAERAHTSLTKMDSETAGRKISVYAAMWDSATSL
jgi:hypothetical protein